MHRTLLALALLSLTAAAQVVHVDASAGGTEDGSSWADAFTDLQDALDVASQGEQVWVAAGTYRPAGSGGDRSLAFAIPHRVDVYGGFDGTEASLSDRGADLFEQTVLSGDLNSDDGAGFLNVGDNSYHVVLVDGVHFPAVLDGFLIEGGNATGSADGEADGGGLFVEGDLTIRNVVFRANRADGAGGGVHVASAVGLTCEDVDFESNESVGDGGGLYHAGGSLTLARCDFLDNTAGLNGGAISIRGDLEIAEGLLRGNYAAKSGGALHCQAAEIEVVATTFQQNSVGSLLEGNGGGVYSDLSKGSFSNCAFSANSADRGGGIGCVLPLLTDPSAELVVDHCVFYGNDALGASAGGGIYSGSFGLVIENTIFWANSGPAGTDFWGQLAGVLGTADYSCIQSMSSETSLFLGEGNFSALPMLVDPVGADGTLGTSDDEMRLGAGSPCIDAGTYPGITALSHDLGGLPRIVDDPESGDTGVGTQSYVDIGAHEYHSFFCDVEEISLSQGGVALLSVNAGEQAAGSFFVVLGSVTGTSPGVVMARHILPLNLDAYLLFTINQLGSPPLFGSFAQLDGDGQGMASFVITPEMGPALAGFDVYHACAVLDLPALRVSMTTTPFRIEFTP